MDKEIMLDDWLCTGCDLVFFTDVDDRPKFDREGARCPQCGERTRHWPSIKPNVKGVLGKTSVGIATSGNPWTADMQRRYENGS